MDAIEELKRLCIQKMKMDCSQDERVFLRRKYYSIRDFVIKTKILTLEEIVNMEENAS